MNKNTILINIIDYILNNKKILLYTVILFFTIFKLIKYIILYLYKNQKNLINLDFWCLFSIIGFIILIKLNNLIKSIFYKKKNNSKIKFNKSNNNLNQLIKNIPSESNNTNLKINTIKSFRSLNLIIKRNNFGYFVKSSNFYYKKEPSDFENYITDDKLWGWYFDIENQTKFISISEEL